MQKNSTCTAGTGTIKITEMVESTSLYLLQSFTLLREQLKTNGYLLIRNIIPNVDKARHTILLDLKTNGYTNASSDISAKMSISPWPIHKPGPSLLSRYDLMQDESVMDALESEEIRYLMNELIDDLGDNDTIECLPYKWLRAVGSGLYTGPHLDRVYLGKNPHLLTCWIPIGNISVSNGALVVAHASHSLPQFKRLREEYGKKPAGKDGTNSGWIHDDPRLIESMYNTGPIDWRSTDFKAGDICIFGIDLLHVSATNMLDEWRISCDTRWYRSCHPYPPY